MMFALVLGLLLLPAEGLAPSTLILRADQKSLAFEHYNGASGRRYLVETMGSGVALFDADGDGLLDIYLIQGAPLPGSAQTPEAPQNTLFRNLGQQKFAGVDGALGLNDSGYGTGVAIGDIDNDGDLDVFVSNFGKNGLYRNDGGHFTNITDSCGMTGESWSTSAAFADLNNDGYLDLYITNYLDFTPHNHQQCTLGKGIPTYCNPDAYTGVADKIYKNLGNGQFQDMSLAAGITQQLGKGLGVILADLDADGACDIYLANDGVANQYLRNNLKANAWNFQDKTLLAGVGHNSRGMAQAGMGVALAAVDSNNTPDLFVTNLSSENNVLYLNSASAFFKDGTRPFGLNGPSLAYTGFGTCFGDFNHNGHQELFITNGHVIDNISKFSDSQHYRQPDQLFTNNGTRFTESPSAFLNLKTGVGRGVARGDLDGDGDLDLVVTQVGGKPTIYWNESKQQGHWLIIQLVGSKSPRDGTGAKVVAFLKNKKIYRWANGGGSYLSAHERIVHLGLGREKVCSKIIVHWPSGHVQSYGPFSNNQKILLKESVQ